MYSHLDDDLNMATDQDQSKKDWLLNIMDCYEGRLIQYTARITGDLEHARDVVQETFLKLWEIKRSKVENYIEQWLYTVCRNRALDLVKKEKRMFSLNPEVDFESTDSDSPTAGIEFREVEGSVQLAIKSLPANQREVISLKFQDGLSYKEISSITGLSVSNVGFLMHSGIKAMRRLLKEQDKQMVKGEGLR